jgi:hypothetical protein
MTVEVRPPADGAVSAPPRAPLVEQAPGDRAPRPVHAGRRRVAFALASVTAIVLALVGVHLYQRSAAEAGQFALSGTIEATEVRVGTQLGGQVKIVYMDEGTPVKTNDPLVSLYSNTIDANEVPKSRSMAWSWNAWWSRVSSPRPAARWLSSPISTP